MNSRTSTPTRVATPVRRMMLALAIAAITGCDFSMGGVIEPLFDPDHTLEFSGVVHSLGDGQPIAGVSVCANVSACSDPVVSNSSGRYQLEVVRRSRGACPQELHFDHADFLPQRVSLPETCQGRRTVNVGLVPRVN